VEIGILVALSLAVLIAGGAQSPSILFDTNGHGHSLGQWVPHFLGFGVFVSIWVLYTFENAGTLGEETIDAKRSAPRAVLGSYAVTMVLGFIFLFCFLIAMPNVSAIAGSSSPLTDVIKSALPNWFSSVYLVLIAWVTILAANTEFTAVVRQMYGMARDDQLPGSRYLARTRANGTPWVATIAVGILTMFPLIESQQLSIVLVGATAAMYTAYFAVSCILLFARVRGWPRTTAPFSLGRWGVWANLAACLGSGAILLNLLWSRPDTNPQWKLGIPVSYWVIGIPLALGAVYYVLVQHRRLSAGNPIITHREAPEEPAELEVVLPPA
jgi:amino acid transporter